MCFAGDLLFWSQWQGEFWNVDCIGWLKRDWKATVIRAIDTDNLIMVGSPRWSHDVDMVADDPIRVVNVACSLHFYAGPTSRGCASGRTPRPRHPNWTRPQNN